MKGTGCRLTCPPNPEIDRVDIVRRLRASDPAPASESDERAASGARRAGRTKRAPLRFEPEGIERGSAIIASARRPVIARGGVHGRGQRTGTGGPGVAPATSSKVPKGMAGESDLCPPRRSAPFRARAG